MKFESKKDKCLLTYKVSMTADEVAPEYKKVFAQFLREAAIPGFRKGKVPAQLVATKFSNEIQKELTDSCINKAFREIVEKDSPAMVHLASVKAEYCSKDAGASMEIAIEVNPEFKLPNYKKIPLEKKEVKVEEAEVTQAIDNFRDRMSAHVAAEDGATVGDGDFVQFDFTGTLDGKPIAESYPDAKTIASAEGFWTQISENRFFPEIIGALKGMKTGETKNDISVKFSNTDYGVPEALSGKTALYTVTLKGIRTKKPPTDEELLKSAEVESMDAFREKIRGYFLDDRKEQEEARRENAACEYLIEKTSIDVPEYLVQNEMVSVVKSIFNGTSPEKLNELPEETRKSILEKARETAEKRIKIYYILREIAKAENIEASDAEIDEAVKAAIAANGQKNLSPEDMEAAKDNAAASIKNKKAIALVIENSK